MSIALQNTKIIQVIAPVAIVDDASWITAEVDTKGWEYATYIFNYGASDIAVAVMKMQESSASGSGMTDVTGLVFGTSNNISGSTSTLPSATDDDSLFVMEFDLRPRKRYLDPVVTAGNGSVGSFMSAVCILSRGHDHPVTAAERGASQVLRL